MVTVAFQKRKFTNKIQTLPELRGAAQTQPIRSQESSNAPSMRYALWSHWMLHTGKLYRVVGVSQFLLFTKYQ
jgi:hypothetical protein